VQPLLCMRVCVCVCVCLVVLGLKLRTYTLSHSTSLGFVYVCVCEGFLQDRSSQTNFPGLASNCDPPDPCLLSSWDYRYDQQCPAKMQSVNMTAI
jgi:hypothetical protein